LYAIKIILNKKEMEPLKELAQGLQILEPFLLQHGFEFDNYENEENFVGIFNIATYKKENKKFIINYIPTIGRVDYQIDNLKAYHDFYIDQLGYADERNFRGFLEGNKLLAFQQILQDFNFLFDDFFLGDCTKLKKLSELNDSILKEYNKSAHKEFSVQLDTIRIETARHEFREKNYLKSYGIYLKVENTNLLNDLDKKLIENCKLHIKL